MVGNMREIAAALDRTFGLWKPALSGLQRAADFEIQRFGLIAPVRRSLATALRKNVLSSIKWTTGPFHFRLFWVGPLTRSDDGALFAAVTLTDQR
jgi:hypothetical protein